MQLWSLPAGQVAVGGGEGEWRDFGQAAVIGRLPSDLAINHQSSIISDQLIDVMSPVLE